ncbi:glycosyl transferase family 39 [bacterium]|nr:glycosyl transferase family 39 [bacterium]
MTTGRIIELVLLVGLLALVVFNLVQQIGQDCGVTNLHLIQAHSLAQGRWDIPVRASDVAVFQNKYYVVFPPMPAILLVPLVKIWAAEAIKVTLVSVVLTLLNVVVLYRIMAVLNVGRAVAAWLLVAFFLGTGYWYCLSMSMWVWFYAQIVGTTFCLLALHEVLVSGRGLTAGLFLGLAVLSRQMLIYSVFFMVTALWKYSPEQVLRRKIQQQLAFLVPLGLCLGFYLLLNWSRFGSIFDTGYAYLQLKGVQGARLERYGLFNPAYILFNLSYMFLQGFHLEFDPPDYVNVLHLDPFGTSLLSASPFVVLALLARWNRGMLVAAWFTIALTLIHQVFYFINGHIQLNAQRYTLDFMPVLILLIALGTFETKPALWKTLIGYAVFLNILAIVWIGFRFE